METHEVEEYEVELYGRNQEGSRTIWGIAQIVLYSSGRKVGEVFTPSRDEQPPHDATVSNGTAFLHAASEQYDRILDLLRNESPVFLKWESISDSQVEDDVRVWVSTSQEPVGEEE